MHKCDCGLHAVDPTRNVGHSEWCDSLKPDYSAGETGWDEFVRLSSENPHGTYLYVTRDYLKSRYSSSSVVHPIDIANKDCTGLDGAWVDKDSDEIEVRSFLYSKVQYPGFVRVCK